MYYVLYKGIKITLTVKIVLTTLIELHENMKQRLWGSCKNIEHKSIGKILRGKPWKCR